MVYLIVCSILIFFLMLSSICLLLIIFIRKKPDDKIQALNGFTTIIIFMICTFLVFFRDGNYLDLAFVYVILNFFGILGLRFYVRYTNKKNLHIFYEDYDRVDI